MLGGRAEDNWDSVATLTRQIQAGFSRNLILRLIRLWNSFPKEATQSQLFGTPKHVSGHSMTGCVNEVLKTFLPFSSN